MTWKNHNNGVGWRFDDTGAIVVARSPVDVLDGWLERFIVEGDGGAWRTVGQPSTMRDLVERYHGDVLDACERWGLWAPTLYALMGVESVKSERQRTRDIFSIRYEPPFDGWEPTEGYDPRRWFSAGLLQTRLLEAQAAVEREGFVFVDAYGEPRPFQPADLMIPAVAIAIGGSHLSSLHARFGGDPMHLNVAWNTGGVRDNKSLRFRLHCHGGDDRVAKFIAYHNDALAVLLEHGLHTGVYHGE
mgnify:CR=1 FL=1